MDLEEVAARVTKAAQLAALLEVSGYPKPGNVHRTADYPDVRYEHFLAGSIAMGSALREAAIGGVMAAEEKIGFSDIGIGEKVEQTVRDANESHHGGNTNLGVALLFVPLAAAAGKTFMTNGGIDPLILRRNVDQIMKSTTPTDSVHVYDAIRATRRAGGREGDRKIAESSWLGSVETGAPSLQEEGARKRLLEESVPLFDWMKASSGWDGIARELTSGMEVSFEVGYPSLVEIFEKHKDINIAVVHTFLNILSEYPDTFVARKVGLEETSNIARAVEIGLSETGWISDAAGSILESGGLTTEEGERKLLELDKNLRKGEGKLNPGTTADLTASSLMISILCGLKF